MPIPVYFATNRNPIESAVANNFGTDFHPDGGLTFGRATIQSVKDESELGNSNLSIDEVTADGFSDRIRKAIVEQGEKNLLIYLHGFDYRFREVVMRAAFLGDWYRRGKPSVPATLIAFSWPSLGSLTIDAYKSDYRNAGLSGGAFRRFLNTLIPILTAYRSADPKRRVSLMAHSMGNHFLDAGLSASIGGAPGQILARDLMKVIDRVFLIASDEDHDCLSSGGLRFAREIAPEVTLYFNQRDVPLRTISRLVHGTGRLGISGPPDRANFAGGNITFVNCSTANRELRPNQRVDPQWHQYYRLVPEVRDDICGIMLGADQAQMPRRVFRKKENYYRLNLA
jgi:esterase/lipase superfamily enzyme